MDGRDSYIVPNLLCKLLPVSILGQTQTHPTCRLRRTGLQDLKLLLRRLFMCCLGRLLSRLLERDLDDKEVVFGVLLASCRIHVVSVYVLAVYRQSVENRPTGDNTHCRARIWPARPISHSRGGPRPRQRSLGGCRSRARYRAGHYIPSSWARHPVPRPPSLLKVPPGRFPWLMRCVLDGKSEVACFARWLTYGHGECIGVVGVDGCLMSSGLTSRYAGVDVERSSCQSASRHGFPSTCIQ